MRSASLDDSQAGIKIAGRNTNNLRYADDTTLTAENGKELKSLLMKVIEESEKACWKLYIQNTKILASSPIISWQIDGENGNSDKCYFLGLQNHCEWDCSHEIKMLLFERKAVTNLDSILKSRDITLPTKICIV